MNFNTHLEKNKLAIINALNSEKSILINEYDSSRTTFGNILLDTCEKLFAYWQEDDLCSMQGQFYYYKDKNTKLVFKESVFGCIQYLDIAVNRSTDTQFDIALVSDLYEVVIVDDLY